MGVRRWSMCSSMWRLRGAAASGNPEVALRDNRGQEYRWGLSCLLWSLCRLTKFSVKSTLLIKALMQMDFFFFWWNSYRRWIPLQCWCRRTVKSAWGETGAGGQRDHLHLTSNVTKSTIMRKGVVDMGALRTTYLPGSREKNIMVPVLTEQMISWTKQMSKHPTWIQTQWPQTDNSVRPLTSD